MIQSILVSVILYSIIIWLTFKARSVFKEYNPKYSLLDDILLFTGFPVAWGYCLYLFINPETYKNPIEQSFSSPMVKIMAVWMIISYVIVLIRTYKKH